MSAVIPGQTGPDQGARGGYPAHTSVDPDCDGSREGCAFRNPNLIYSELACGQRCLFPEQTAGTPSWYGRISNMTRESGSPIYIVGARGSEAARRSFARRSLLLRDDFVGSVLEIPNGETQVDAVLPKGAS